jgi:hypothetical protein
VRTLVACGGKKENDIPDHAEDEELWVHSAR